MAFDWTVILSIGGAFGAASTAQYFSHRLTKKREDIKYKKEQYQNFYSPLVFKITRYVESEGDTRSGINKDSTPDPEQVFKSIISTIEDNIQYADSSFIRVYENARIQEMIESKTEDQPKSRYANDYFDFQERINVFEQFLSDYLIISSNLKVLSKNIEREVKRVLAIIKLYKLYHDYFLIETAERLFSHGNSIIFREDDVDDFILKLNRVGIITDYYIKLYDEKLISDPHICYDALFSLLESFEPALSRISKYTQIPIKEGLEEDAGILGYKAGFGLDSKRIDNIDF
ncbi:hypothetical protein [Domibacillus robiginosus]|uniref:hypothetical protein n=1 Tax=Domibacillus robiginosus TaxID=1071054 RepID=UPI00067AD530|nr:hypothetical protein [Domibacillus robiginosus]